MKNLFIICIFFITTSCVSLSKYKELISDKMQKEDSLREAQKTIENLNANIYWLNNKIDSLNGVAYFLESDRDYFKNKGIELYHRVDSLKEVVRNMPKIDSTSNKLKKEMVPVLSDEFIETKVDKMRDITFYESKRITNQTVSSGLVYFYVYISKTKSGVKNLRLYTKFRGDDWIFYDKVYVLGSDNSKTLINCEYPQKQSDNNSEYVYEWSDNLLSRTQILLLTKISETEVITVRFTGKYYVEFDLSEQQVLGLKEIINKYWTL